MASVSNTDTSDVLPLPDKPSSLPPYQAHWDPLKSADWVKQKPVPSSLLRIKKLVHTF